MQGDGAAYLAESVEDVVEVDEYLTLGNFCNVVHGFAGVIPYARILVCEAGKNRRDYGDEILCQFLAEDTRVEQ